MKRELAFVAALTFTGLAVAAPPTTYDADKYLTCGTHSFGAVLMAKDSILLKRPVEAILNENYKSPDILDVKLALLAVDAMNAGLGATPADVGELQHFLTGVCYESALPPKHIVLQK